jgi:cytochrome c peroxidase
MKKAGPSILLVSALLLLILALVPRVVPQGSAKQLDALRAKIRSEFGAELPPVPFPVDNPQTPEKIKLGEALFFDPNLSACGTIACASCHIPEKGFSDEQQISDGCGGATGRRNSNTVYNTSYSSHMFWDGRVQTLEEQALGPVVDGAEMANTWDHVLSYLTTGVHPGTKKEFPEAKNFYAKYFQAVFGGEITTSTVTKAIAAYERTAVSVDSPYDKWVKGDDKALTPQQLKGLSVFFGKGNCVACHRPPNFSDFDFHNTGVPNAGFEVADKYPQNANICGGIPKAVDPGRGEVGFLRSSCSDLGKFKTPTLRNVELSLPYMHNGKFGTLAKALSHYEELAKGNVKPVVGTLDHRLVKGAFQFGAGGGQSDDLKNVTEFLKALTGTQIQSPAAGVGPPVLK